MKPNFKYVRSIINWGRINKINEKRIDDVFEKPIKEKILINVIKNRKTHKERKITEIGQQN